MAASPTSSSPRPPGPSTRWLGLDLIPRFSNDFLGLVTGLQARYGDMVYLRLGQFKSYFLFSPVLIREALVDHADAFIRWERSTDVFAQLFGQSVLVTEGPTWQRQRRMLMPGFSPRRVAGYAGLMVAASREALDSVSTDLADQPALVDMDALMTRLTMDVIMRTLFSSHAPADAAEAGEASQVLNQSAYHDIVAMMRWPDWLPLPYQRRKRWAVKTLHALVDRELRRRRKLPPGQAPQDDLLAMLLAVHDEEAADAACAGLSDTELHDQCMVMFQAGHETSATALVWWSRLMAEHAQALARARQEVDTVLQGREPTPDDLARMPWLNATLKEAMRLYPPVGTLMTRRAIHDVRIGQWTVPRGALVQVVPWVTQRDARWFTQPDLFMPQRFMDPQAVAPRSAWLPFGTGPRVCIGQHFAMLEMGLIAAMLLQRFELAVLPRSRRPEPVMGVTLRPAGGLNLLMSSRVGL